MRSYTRCTVESSTATCNTNTPSNLFFCLNFSPQHTQVNVSYQTKNKNKWRHLWLWYSWVFCLYKNNILTFVSSMCTQTSCICTMLCLSMRWGVLGRHYFILEFQVDTTHSFTCTQSSSEGMAFYSVLFSPQLNMTSICSNHCQSPTLSLLTVYASPVNTLARKKPFPLFSLTAPLFPSFLCSWLQIWKQHQAVQGQSGRLPFPGPGGVRGGVRRGSDRPPPELSPPQQRLRPGPGAPVAASGGPRARGVRVVQSSRSPRLSAREEGEGAQTGQELSHHRLGWHRWGRLGRGREAGRGSVLVKHRSKFNLDTQHWLNLF